MNVEDPKGVVHRVMQAPVRGGRDGELHPLAGMTECVAYFRWFGQTPFVNTEFAGRPVETSPTCLFCAIES